MGAEVASPKVGVGIPGIGTEEPPVLHLCVTTECAGRIGSEGSARFPPADASMVRQRLPRRGNTGV